MDKPRTSETTSQYILRMLENGETRDDIRVELLHQGHGHAFVTEVLEETVKLHQAAKRVKGLTLILIGGITCFVSFLLTIMEVFPGDSYGYVLFGLTGAGVLVAFFGCTKVF